MKIIASLPNFKGDSKVDPRVDSKADARVDSWLAWPDSCLLPSDRPLYIPDFDSRFFAIPALALKSGRLGKGIAPKFALRYFSEYSGALIILPQCSISDLRDAILPGSPQLCFDNAVVIGETIAMKPDMGKYPADEALNLLAAGVPDSFCIEIHHAPASPAHAESPLPAEEFLHGKPDTRSAAETLAAASTRNTIKTGDFILSPLEGVDPIPLAEGMEIRISLDVDTSARILLRTRFK